MNKLSVRAAWKGTAPLVSVPFKTGRLLSLHGNEEAAKLQRNGTQRPSLRGHGEVS